MTRIIKTQITNENAAEFNIQLDALFDAENRVINETEGDWRTTFEIEVHSDEEQSWVEILAEEIEA